MSFAARVTTWVLDNSSEHRAIAKSRFVRISTNPSLECVNGYWLWATVTVTGYSAAPSVWTLMSVACRP